MDTYAEIVSSALNGAVNFSGYMLYDYDFKVSLEIHDYNEIFEFSVPHDYFPSREYTVGPRDEVSLSITVFPKGRTNISRGTTEYAMQVSVNMQQEFTSFMYLSDIRVFVQNKHDAPVLLYKHQHLEKLMKDRSHDVINRKPSTTVPTSENDLYDFNPVKIHDCEQPHRFPDMYVPKDVLTLVVRGVLHVPCTCKSVEIEKIRQSDTLMQNLTLYAPFFNKQCFSDVIIQLQGTNNKLYAHRIVLAAHSPVFTKMFQEVTGDDFLHGRFNIKIKDFYAKVVVAGIKFLYSFSCQEIESLARQLVLFAHTYNINILKEFCENELIRSMNVENILEVYKVASVARATKTILACRKFSNDNMNKLATMGNYLNVDGKFIDDIVKIFDAMDVRTVIAKRGRAVTN